MELMREKRARIKARYNECLTNHQHLEQELNQNHANIHECIGALKLLDELGCTAEPAPRGNA